MFRALKSNLISDQVAVPSTLELANLRRRATVLLIEETEADGDTLWSRIDAALEEGMEVWVRSPLLRLLTECLGRERDGNRWLVLKPRARRYDRWNRHILRARDIILGGAGIFLFFPVMLVVGAFVKVTSAGPVFFATSVVGAGRRSFVWRKFRSMFVEGKTDDERQRKERFRAYVEGKNCTSSKFAPKKVVNVRRVTPVGRIIRKYSLDELPQLWNVVKGDMSLVGPRPCLPYEAEFYTAWRDRRFNVRPGLTGVWQVFGRGRTSFDEAAAMDVYYLYRRSFFFDLYLILKTVRVVMKGIGAL